MNTRTILCGQYKIQTIRTAGLSEERLPEIIEQIKGMYLWFAPASTEDDMKRRLRQHDEACIDILTHIESDECRGFSIYYTEQFNGLRVMYRGGTIVRDRSLGLYKSLLRHSICEEDLDFVVAMTQNPRVYESLRSFASCGVAYPSPNSNVPQTIKLIAQEFCKAPGLDADSMIVSGVYDDIRKDKDFKLAKDHLVEKFFADSLGVDDGFFVVVPVR